jgi:hypothetical protein
MAMAITKPSVIQTADLGSEVTVFAMPATLHPTFDQLLKHHQSGEGGRGLSTARFLVFVADPISWSVIAWEIIKAIGGKILGNMFESLFNKGMGTGDLVRFFISSVTQIIDKKLEEHWIELIAARLNGLSDTLGAYSRSPDSRAGTLPLLLLGADDLYRQAEAINLPGLGVATIAAPLRFAVNAELYRISSTTGDYETLGINVQAFGAYIDKMDVEIAKASAAMFTEFSWFKSRWAKDEGIIEAHGEYSYRGRHYYFDEEIVGRRAHMQHKLKALENLMTKLSVPARAVLQGLQDALNDIDQPNAAEENHRIR